jgi:hypothetical protein
MTAAAANNDDHDRTLPMCLVVVVRRMESVFPAKNDSF